jgi:long-subunit acyl-CoA synthetase (AMP-forming)
MIRSGLGVTPIRDTLRAAAKYCGLADFIERTDNPALRFPDPGKPPITHKKLGEFVDNFSLPSLSVYPGESQGWRRKPIVCIALPNGPALAAVCLAVGNRYIASPVNSAVGGEQFRADVLQSGASCILTTKEDAERLGFAISPVCDQRGRPIPVFLVQYGDDGNEPLVEILSSSGARGPTRPEERVLANGPDDIAIVLFTSGTSGTKKTVPITVHNIVSGVRFVVSSWALTEKDICLNMMPLYHM